MTNRGKLIFIFSAFLKALKFNLETDLKVAVTREQLVSNPRARRIHFEFKERAHLWLELEIER